MNRTSIIVLTVLLAVLCGCAPVPVQRWYSEPARQSAANQDLKVTIEPIKEGQPYYSAFLLTIENKTGDHMQIDWNATRYLHQGKDLGVFIFEGVGADRIKENIPPDDIPPGSTFTRMIFPLRTIAFLPGEQKTKQDQLGFMAGVLPAGENGIRLVINHKGRTIDHSLSVRLRAETVPGP